MNSIRRIILMKEEALKKESTKEKRMELPGALERAFICARTADENKAKDILVLDMRKISPLYDYFVIATGSSRRQIHNIAEEIDDRMKKVGEKRLGLEGYEASRWIVQDYGDVVVHIFDKDARFYYSLEELWADAERMDWKQ